MRVLTFVTIGAALALVGRVAGDDYPLSGRERIEWCDIWIPDANAAKLPRVLLLGDSITRGYSTAVEKRLADKAYVARLATSAFISDPSLLDEIALVLDHNHFDVIQFNNGMHGWSHSEAEYRQAFPSFLAAIRQHAPQAKLIWASTTWIAPAPEPAAAVDASATDKGKLMVKADLTTASNERIRARNAIAREYVDAAKIPVDDLYALTENQPEYHQGSGSVHFNAKGIAAQADQVAAIVARSVTASP